MDLCLGSTGLCDDSLRVEIDLATAPQLTLTDGEVHIWSASLETGPEEIERVINTLDSRERDHARKFRFAKDRNRFIAARALLRRILSLYVEEDPDRIAISYGARGKPALSPNSRTKKRDVRFNSSHSGVLALYAVAREREVGIDVERIQTLAQEEAIAEQLFCASEIAALRSLTGSRRTEAFFRCWTRKEAYVKARGEGFRIPLNSFEVLSESGEPAAITDNEGANWLLQSFVPAPGYAAALVTQGESSQIRFIALKNSDTGLLQTRDFDFSLR